MNDFLFKLIKELKRKNIFMIKSVNKISYQYEIEYYIDTIKFIDYCKEIENLRNKCSRFIKYLNGECKVTDKEYHIIKATENRLIKNK
jgi:hypothetical protein